MTPFISGLLLTSAIVMVLTVAGGLISLIAAMVFDAIIGRAVSGGRAPILPTQLQSRHSQRNTSTAAWRPSRNPWTAASTSL